MKIHNFLAFDLGATSGRSVLGTLKNGKIEIRELTRFPNGIIELHGKFYWNLLGLYEHLKEGLVACAKEGVTPDSIGIDTWGVDVVPIGEDGSILGMPRAYRDPYTNGAPERYFEIVPREEVYDKTGIQIMNFNTLFQIFAAVREGYTPIVKAKKLLFMPDALSYMLTGKEFCEYTIASTSQILNPRNGKFEKSLLKAAGVSVDILPEPQLPGVVVGALCDALATETRIGKVDVVAVAGHDTASAVAAVPAENERFAYLSSGTWSLMGIETREPIITEESFRHNFTNEGGIDGANWFLSTVTNEKVVVSAKWMTAGLGVYELYINGNRVGNEFLKPGYTSTDKTKRSFTYDITDAFQTKEGAENTLSVQVTPGWWADRIVSPRRNIGMTGEKCAFRGVLELTFADGSTKLYGTNLEDWKAGIAGPVKHAGIYDGEEYDAREKMGFETPEKLATPEENTEFAGEILPSEGAEIYLRHDLTLSPVKAYTYNGVENASEEAYGKVVVVREFAPKEKIVLNAGETLVVDFGQNCSAVPAFEFKAAEGTTLTCLPSEILNDGNGAKSRGVDGPEGSAHRRNLRIQDDGIRLIYTFAGGDGYVSYIPRYTFFGYRYISVTATNTVHIKSVKSIPVTSVTSEMEICKITTGNELINKLISNTYWGEVSNYLSVPTDCPQRDERLGWTADAQVFVEAGTYFANTQTFFRKWLRDVRDCQHELGGYSGVAPAGPHGDHYMRLGWADAGVIVPWVMWKQFGDTKIVDEHWESMERYMKRVDETKYDHMKLIGENHEGQYADWVSFEPLESHIFLYKNKRILPSGRVYVPEDALNYWNFMSASYWAIDATYMADMAAATGRDEVKYRDMAERAKAYIKAKFVNADGTFKTKILNTMQTPALFALKVGVVEGEGKAAMIERLRQNFKEHDGCLQTGFLGTSLLMPVLTDNGMVDVAYDLLFQCKCPSWLYSIDNGATTIWERWNSYTEEGGLSKSGMNSFNHYAYGCVCEWIWETVAGISSDVSAPGFKHIVMKPVPDKRLGFVTAEYNSAAGLIKSAWRYEDKQWIWEFTIPDGATASVTLPGEQEATLYTSGTYKIER